MYGRVVIGRAETGSRLKTEIGAFPQPNDFPGLLEVSEADILASVPPPFPESSELDFPTSFLST